MKRTIDIWLGIAVVVPVVLLLWPFAMWNDGMSLVLRVIPSLAAQALLCRIGKWNMVKAIPVLLTGAAAAWGTYLYCTSPHWSNATVWGYLVPDYVSPFICCLVVLVIDILVRKRKHR